MPLMRARAGRPGVIGRPVARTALVQSIGEPIPRVDLTTDAVDAWITAERKRLLGPMETEERARHAREDAATRPLTADERGTSASAFEAAGVIRAGGPAEVDG